MCEIIVLARSTLVANEVDFVNGISTLASAEVEDSVGVVATCRKSWAVLAS